MHLEREDGRMLCEHDVLIKTHGHRIPNRIRKCANLALPGELYCAIHLNMESRKIEEARLAEIQKRNIEKDQNRIKFMNIPASSIYVPTGDEYRRGWAMVSIDALKIFERDAYDAGYKSGHRDGGLGVKPKMIYET